MALVVHPNTYHPKWAIRPRRFGPRLPRRLRGPDPDSATVVSVPEARFAARLISWSRDEVPPSILEGRVARLRKK